MKKIIFISSYRTKYIFFFIGEEMDQLNQGRKLRMEDNKKKKIKF